MHAPFQCGKLAFFERNRGFLLGIFCMWKTGTSYRNGGIFLTELWYELMRIIKKVSNL